MAMSLKLDRRAWTSREHTSRSRFRHIPRHVTAIATQDSISVEREESLRAYWMIEMLDSMTTLGGSLCHTQLLTLKLPPTARLPCPESTWWSLQDAASKTTTSNNSPSITNSVTSEPQQCASSIFCLCIILVLQELGAVHQFLNEPHDLTSLEKRLEWQTAAQSLDERLTQWREEFVADVFRLINNAEKNHLPQGEMEPFITLTNCVLNT